MLILLTFSLLASISLFIFTNESLSPEDIKFSALTLALILVPLIALIVDFHKLKKIIRNIYNVRYPHSDSDFTTSLAKSIAQDCESVRFKIHSLQNTIDEYERLQKIREYGEIVTSSVNEKDFYNQLLNFVQKFLHINAVALVLKNKDKISIYSQFSSSERFTRTIQNIINTNQLWQNNQNYLAEKNDILEKLGITEAFFLPLVQSEELNKKNAILWLGYSHHITPVEKLLAQEVQKKIGSEIVSQWLISELGEKVEKARSDSHEKNEFIKHVSHDIRSPLNNIKTVLSLIQSSESSNENRKMLEMGLKNCLAMSEILEDILDLSKYNVGRLTPQKKVTDINVIISDVVESYQISAKTKGLELINRSDKLNDISIDPHHFKRILTNLVSNAVKYTPSGKVKIEAFQIAEQCIIKVSDTGIGMTEDQIKALSVQFTRFQPEIADGSGLGFSLTKVLTELNGGDLQVDSKPNSGTCITLSFPSLSNKTQTPKEPQKEIILEDIPKKTPCNKVLIVDNDQDCVTSLGRALEKSGFNVSTAITVENACDQIKIWHPDILISDSNMPSGGGKKIVEFIRSEKLSIVTIIVSGDEEAELHNIYAGLNVDKFLIKPVDIQALKDFIKNI